MVAVAVSRFVAGTGIANPLGIGFAFHHTLSVPYLSASGLKGALRDNWTAWHEDEPARQDVAGLLGSAEDGADAIILFDMLPTGPVKVVPEVIMPHCGDWYQSGGAPGEWLSSPPIPFIVVEAGAVFQIAVAPRVFGGEAWREADCARLKGFIEKSLDIIGLGDKTATGYGRFLLSDSEAEVNAILMTIHAALGREWVAS